jgi:alpha-beta hydrolase superfamily lysophospholipase
MAEALRSDYSLLDHPQILGFLFHPRPSYGELDSAGHQVLIAVDENVVIGGQFHMATQAAPNILFFHGNGEIVDDYADLGPVYNRLDINFLAVDYRGYGHSTGAPTVSTMMRDCHTLFHYVKQWLAQHDYTGPLLVMGRSLGSACALELAQHYADEITGMIIESGFAYTVPLLKLVGIDADSLGISEQHGVANLEKIKTFAKPTLIIHAEQDHIIPLSDGQALYQACPATEKHFLKIPYANHNNIMALGFSEYMAAIKTFCQPFRT